MPTQPAALPSLEEILALVQEDLARVEAELGRESGSGIESVREIADYILSAGGKRLRPALHLLAARTCGFQEPGSIRLGAILELIHNATLIHDDVIDSSDMRRGRASTNRQWGNSMTVLAGDWLYMQSFRMALELRNFRILDILIGLTQAMVEGELIQLQWLGRADIPVATCLDISRRKTARLFEASTQLAAVLAGRPEEEERRMAVYGLNLGLAFQVVDDLLDFTSTEAALGKPVLSDLREGKVTLPLVCALSTAPDENRRKVETVLAEREFRTVRAEEILDLIREHDAVEQTRRHAAELLSKAVEALAPLPESPCKRALETLPHFILDRRN